VAGQPRIMTGRPANVVGWDPGTFDCAGHPPKLTVAMNVSFLRCCYLSAGTVLDLPLLLFDPPQLSVNSGL